MNINIILNFYSKYLISKKITILMTSLILASTFGQAQALQQTADKLNYNVNLGESQTLQWGILSDEDDVTIIVEIFAKGLGSELLSFPDSIEITPHAMEMIDFTVTVPKDYQNNIELKPIIYALQSGSIEDGVSGTIIHIQMAKPLSIKIGDAPVYVAPVPSIRPPVIEEPKEDKKDTMMVEKEDTGFTFEEEKQCGAGTELVNGICSMIITEEPEDGGCLIATAAFNTELAPQVQMLREIRDNTLFSTTSGTSFMTGFNTLYYSFAPTISDWERENPMFKEMVKTAITPMLSTLSIMSLADEGSEVQVLGLGISIIALNLAMYMGIPLGTIVMVKRKLNN